MPPIRSATRRPTSSHRHSLLQLEPLEDRANPVSGWIAVGADAGGEPRVRLLDAATLNEVASFYAFEPSFSGGVSVAVGDVNADGVVDVVAASGAGGGPHVRVFSGADLSVLGSFFAYAPTFIGGVNVAVGNLDGQPGLEIVTAPESEGGPHVRSFKLVYGTATQLNGSLGSFFAFESTFTGGVSLAVGDVTGDGTPAIIAGASAGGAPHLQVFTAAGVMQSFYAYDPAFRGGVHVAAGDVNGDGADEIVTGAGPGGGPQVQVIRAADRAVLASFYGGEPTSTSGIFVAVTDRTFDGFAEIIVSDEFGERPVRIFTLSGSQAAPDGSFTAFEGFSGGVESGGVGRNAVIFHGFSFADATFIDPTAAFIAPNQLNLGKTVLLAPFTVLDASAGTISIGEKSNAQDNVLLSTVGPTTSGDISIGDHMILAHGVSVFGPASIGKPHGKPSFASFNAVIDGAIIEEDAVVSALARVGPGVVIRSGTKVLPGKFVTTQAEADNPDLGKVTSVTTADRDFMKGVLHVNEELARGYSEMVLSRGLHSVMGISANPGDSDFNSDSHLPDIDGVHLADPTYRNRIIGDVTIGNTREELDTRFGNQDSIRADEGPRFAFGSLESVADRFTAHALEYTEITVGENARFGFHTVLHGGEDSANSPRELTRLGDKVTVNDWAVVFRSTLGNNVTVGFRALVDGSNLPDGTVVPDRAILIGGELIGFVEW